MPNAVTILRIWVDFAESLPSDAERGQLYHAVCCYSLYGRIPKLSGLLKTGFELMRPEIDKSNLRRKAQRAGVKSRLQNDLQCNLQTDLQCNLQTGLQNAQSAAESTDKKAASSTENQLKSADLQTDLQMRLQNAQSAAESTDQPAENAPAKKTPFNGPPCTPSLIPCKNDYNINPLCTDGINNVTPAPVRETPFPAHLDTPEFAAKWEEWERYRRIRGKSITPMARSRQLKLLSRYDVPTALGIIEYSITMDYQGLFPPKAARPLKRDYRGI